MVSLLVPLSLAHARVLVCVSVRTATEDSSHHTDRQILRSAGPARIMDECDCNCNCNAESAKRECARCDLSLSLPPCFGWRGCVCVLYSTFHAAGQPSRKKRGKSEPATQIRHATRVCSLQPASLATMQHERGTESESDQHAGSPPIGEVPRASASFLPLGLRHTS